MGCSSDRREEMAESKLTSVIIPWKDRPELRQCLEANARYFSSDRCEVIVVNCGGDRELLESLLEGLAVDVHLVYVRHPAFNKCLAQNIGAAVAKGRILLLLDADVLLKDDLLQLASQAVGPQRFLTVASVRESDSSSQTEGTAAIEIAHQLEISLPGGKRIRIETNRTRPLEGNRSGPGLIAVLRRQYFAVGGANSSLRGWGWEDLDLIVRLQFELGLDRVQSGQVIHLSHPDSARILSGRTRTECEQENFITCLANYAADIFYGTLDHDAKSFGMQINPP
jgi:glycosyltransferase involved in cell wall biosynthesis